VSTRQRRTRRTSADIQALLVDAARDLFRTQGFEATTTKQIAERAGVAEPLLFTNFGSKADLFDVAVLEPIAEFVTDYAASWATTDVQVPEQRVDEFVRGLYAMAGRDRTVLLTALARRLERHVDGEPDVLDRVAGRLQGLAGVSELEQYEDVDPPAALAAVLGMVLGVGLLDDLLFPRNSRRPSRDRLIAEMEKLTLYGITRRGASDDERSGS
jgi:AcrR family transcriptional regulator